MQANQFGFGYIAVAVCAGAALVAAMTVPVRAAEDVAAVVGKRQAAMKAMSANVKIISQYTEGSADQSAAVAAVKIVQDTAKTVPSLFPPATGMEQLPGKSGAKPEIWTDPRKFKDAAAALVTGSDELAKSVAAGDPAATRASLLALGKTGCGTCHDAYRVKI
jgi:cytochrome c556